MTVIKYPLEAEDLEQMLVIEQKSFPSPWRREDIAYALTASGEMRCLGILQEGNLCGWGCFRLGLYEAHLMTVAICPDERGKGLGKKLTRAILQAAADSGARVMELECRKSNLPAQRLYRALGFQRVGERKGYYTDTGEDALLYVHLNLPEGDPESDPFLIRE